MVTGFLKHWLSSLSGRLVAWVLLIQVILVLFLFGIVLYGVTESFKDQFVNDARSSAGLLARSLSMLDIRSEQETAVGLMDEALLDGRAVFIELHIPEGRVIESNFTDGSPAGGFQEDLLFGSHGDATYFIKIPLYHTGIDTPAQLKVGYDESAVQKQIARAHTVTATLVCAYIVLTFVAVSLIGRKTIKPLEKLRKVSRAISNGEVTAQLNIDTNISDIQDLARDLEQMRGELVRQARELEYQALHDSLTGLPNRKLLDDRLSQACLQGARDGTLFALLLLDLDHFKEVNDTLGHQAGDNLLRQAGRRISDKLRSADSVARLGGDEFAILLHNVGEPEAQAVARSVAETMMKPFQLEEQPVLLSASIGISLFPVHSKDPVALLRQADVAMYAAKNRGNQVVVYNSERDRHSFVQLSMKNDMLEGLQRDEFNAWFQPKQDLITGLSVSAEALVRWTHPRSGLIMPDNFIDLAERSGLISELTDRMLRQVARQYVKALGRCDRLRIAINLSPISLRDDSLPARIKEILEFEGWSPGCLDLEITERAILQSPEQAKGLLSALKDMGIGILIDDFGTGYSSLMHLKQLPVTELKIDRSFIKDILQDQDDMAIVRATIRMARDLGLKVTAEGVETREIADLLADMGCDSIQGYYLGKPMPWEQFLSWRQAHLQTVKAASNCRSIAGNHPISS